MATNRDKGMVNRLTGTPIDNSEERTEDSIALIHSIAWPRLYRLEGDTDWVRFGGYYRPRHRDLMAQGYGRPECHLQSLFDLLVVQKGPIQ